MMSSKTRETEVKQDDQIPDAPTGPKMGSEYMDARTYLTQATRAPRVKESDETFHGSNDSDYGIALQKI